MNGIIDFMKCKRLITLALFITNAMVSLKAQQSDEIMEYVFETDNRGCVTKKVPVFKETDKVTKTKCEYLSVHSEG